MGGYRSFEAFWIGGASAVASIVPPVPVQINAGAGILRKKRKISEDDTIITIILQQIAQTLWKRDD